MSQPYRCSLCGNTYTKRYYCGRRLCPGAQPNRSGDARKPHVRTGSLPEALEQAVPPSRLSARPAPTLSFLSPCGCNPTQLWPLSTADGDARILPAARPHQFFPCSSVLPDAMRRTGHLCFGMGGPFYSRQARAFHGHAQGVFERSPSVHGGVLT